MSVQTRFRMLPNNFNRFSGSNNNICLILNLAAIQNDRLNILQPHPFLFQGRETGDEERRRVGATDYLILD